MLFLHSSLLNTVLYGISLRCLLPKIAVHFINFNSAEAFEFPSQRHCSLSGFRFGFLLDLLPCVEHAFGIVRIIFQRFRVKLLFQRRDFRLKEDLELLCAFVDRVFYLYRFSAFTKVSLPDPCHLLDVASNQASTSKEFFDQNSVLFY